VNLSFIRYQSGDHELPKMLTAGEAFIDLEKVQGRPAGPALDQIEINIVSKGAVQSALNIAAWFREWRAARVAALSARAVFDSAQERLQAACRELEALRAVMVPLLVMNGLAALVAVFTEIGLTWSVLPAFLNIPPESVLGYAMGGLTLVLTSENCSLT
jgi:hypothetical protein